MLRQVGEEVWGRLDEMEQRILTFMGSHIEVTRAQVEEYIGKSHRTITTHLNSLMDLGVIKRNGNKFDPGHTYSLIIKELQG